jgi:hypothetical protein
MQYALKSYVTGHTPNPVHAIRSVKKLVNRSSRIFPQRYLPLGIIFRQPVNILLSHAFYSMQRNKQHIEGVVGFRKLVTASHRSAGCGHTKRYEP